MSANEIKALQKKIKEDEQELRSLLKKARIPINYNKLLLKKKKFEQYIAKNKIPKSEKGLPREFNWYYSAFVVKELFLLKLKFENCINSNGVIQQIERLLSSIYNVNHIRSCIKEEDILPLSSLISEEDFAEIDLEEFYPLLSEIFTNEKLMDIVSKIEASAKGDLILVKTVSGTLSRTFSLEERIKYFSPEVNFVIDISSYLGEGKITCQTSLNIDPSLFYPRQFKDYIDFLEGKIDPGLHTELYLTYCQ